MCIKILIKKAKALQIYRLQRLCLLYAQYNTPSSCRAMTNFYKLFCSKYLFFVAKELFQKNRQKKLRLDGHADQNQKALPVCQAGRAFIYSALPLFAEKAVCRPVLYPLHPLAEGSSISAAE